MFSKSGLLKEGDKSLISLAKDITYKRVVGRIPNEGQRELYERGVKTGMLNSQVEANIMRKIFVKQLLSQEKYMAKLKMHM